MMKKANLGEKFEQVLKQLEEIETRKKDTLITPDQIKITDSGTIGIEGLGAVGFTKTGFQTFCGRLDIPSEYMLRLANKENKKPEHIAEDLKLFKMSLDRGIDRLKNDKEMLFRTIKNKENDNFRVRAVFSDNYNVIDNLPIIQEIGKFDYSKLETKNFAVTSDYMDLRFTMPDRKVSLGKLPSHEVKFGVEDDIVFPGIHIRNSETGKSRIVVDFIIYRLVCTNGLVSTKNSYQVINKKHIGEYDFAEVNKRMADVVIGVEKYFNDYVEAMIAARETKLSDIEEIIPTLSRRVGINKPMAEVVLENWRTEQAMGDRKIDLVNAITAGARDWESKMKDFSGRLNLEKVAGDMLLAKVA